MNEMTLCGNLEQLMRIHGNLSVSDLARHTNIPQPTLHHILAGATKNPRKKSLDALAEFFSVSQEQLIGNDALPKVIPEAMKEDLKLNTIPIIQWDMLNHWPDKALQSDPFQEVLFDKNISKHSFALVMEDASMEPTFPKNALMIFDAGKPAIDRDFVIVRCENKIIFNRLFIDKQETYIKQDLQDGNASLIKLDKQRDHIIGTLVEARIQY